MEVSTMAVAGLRSAGRIFSQDLEALPPDAFARKFGAKTRTVADIVYEVILVNDHVELTMRQVEAFPWPEGWITAPADFSVKDAIIAAFKTSLDRVVQTAESYSESDFEVAIPTDQGETTRLKQCQFMTLHLWYHSGQLNFIQTLLGDDQWHWAG